ncbi:MAG: hypothetical protein QXF52_02925 [Thermoproteota archaeon]
MIPRVVEFLVAWGISSIIIYLAVIIYPRKREKNDLVNSVVTALLGAIVFEIFAYLGIPLGGLLSLIIWLFILKKMFKVGWISAVVIAVIIWVLNIIISMLGIPRLL